MQQTTNQTEKQKLKHECLALSDEKIKTAMQLEKELKKSINYINNKLSVVQSEIVKNKEIEQQTKVEVIKPPPKKLINKEKGQEDERNSAYNWQ